MPTMAYQRVGNCVVLCHGEASPSNEEWDAYVNFLAQQPAPRTRILVFTRGGAPSAIHRKKLAAVVDEHYGGQVPTAVMTDSAMARGVVTAITWLTNKGVMAAFPLAKLDEAATFLQLAPGSMGELRLTIAKLEAEIRSSKSAGA